MKLIVLPVILILVSSVAGVAKVPAPRTLLEARVSSVGMVATTENYLFLRILDDGQVEYKEDVFENNTHRFVLRKSKLSPSQLGELTDFLNDPELREAAREYEPDVPTIDHIVTFDISINRDSLPQTIKLTNYAPSLPKAADKYPPRLIELVCRMRSMRRNNAKSRIILNDCSFR
jgi:hypothetical protein